MTAFIILTLTAFSITFALIYVDLKNQLRDAMKQLLIEQLKNNTPSLEDAMIIVESEGYMIVREINSAKDIRL